MLGKPGKALGMQYKQCPETIHVKYVKKISSQAEGGEENHLKQGTWSAKLMLNNYQAPDKKHQANRICWREIDRIHESIHISPTITDKFLEVVMVILCSRPEGNCKPSH